MFDRLHRTQPLAAEEGGRTGWTNATASAAGALQPMVQPPRPAALSPPTLPAPPRPSATALQLPATPAAVPPEQLPQARGRLPAGWGLPAATGWGPAALPTTAVPTTPQRLPGRLPRT